MIGFRPGCLLLMGVFLFCGWAKAGALPPAFDPVRHMSVDEVHPGMKGYGLSVFHGTAIEKFQVQVVDILHNFNPQGDVILIRCSGQNLEHTGPIQGMSGSPIYLYGADGKPRMVGAFAYGWSLQKDPIAGVQPIEYMLALPAAGKTGGAQDDARSPVRDDGRKPGSNEGQNGDGLTPDGAVQSADHALMRWNIADVVSQLRTNRKGSNNVQLSWQQRFMNPDRISYFDAPGTLKPLMTPLMVSGLDDRLVREISPILESYGLTAMQAGGSTSAPAEKNKDEAVGFEPGSVLAVPLLTGDVDLTAIGTVTEVLGDRVYGFGHPFNNEGPVAWPMGTGRVNAIIASIVSSFKLGSMLDVAGTLHSDAMTGVAGAIGAAPKMIPIDLDVKYADGSSARHYHFNAAIHPQITPMLVYYALRTAMSSAQELPQYHTIEYDLNLEFADGQQVQVKNTAVNDGFGMIGGDVMLAVQLANDNPFERVYLSKVTGEMRIIPQAREAEILSVNIPRLKYRPGQTVRGYVTYRPFRGAESSLPFELVLPQNLDDGQYRLVISDRNTYLAQLLANEPFRFYVESTQQIFDAVRALEQYQRSALYLQLIKNPTGVAVGRTAMPSLPSSRQQVLLKSGRSNTTIYTPSVVRVMPNALQMLGAAEFMIEIDKSAKVEVAGQLPQEPQKQRPHDVPSAQPQNPAQKHEPVVPPGEKPSQGDQTIAGQQVINQR